MPSTCSPSIPRRFPRARPAPSITSSSPVEHPAPPAPGCRTAFFPHSDPHPTRLRSTPVCRRLAHHRSSLAPQSLRARQPQTAYWLSDVASDPLLPAEHPCPPEPDIRGGESPRQEISQPGAAGAGLRDGAVGDLGRPRPGPRERQTSGRGVGDEIERGRRGTGRQGDGRFDREAEVTENLPQDMIPKMWTQEEFSWDSPTFRMPPRNVLPKPIQRPHPPLWMSGTQPDSAVLAGERGSR
jgi:hypothetical protein